MQFLQLGKWIFAIDRILAIDLMNKEAGCLCVALWIAGHNEPWYFLQESEEAKALLKWAKLNAKRLVGFEQPGGAQ